MPKFLPKFTFKLPYPVLVDGNWTMKDFTISCSLEYARWLVNRERVYFGVWEDLCCKVYV
jgi:hypothetical protein